MRVWFSIRALRCKAFAVYTAMLLLSIAAIFLIHILGSCYMDFSACIRSSIILTVNGRVQSSLQYSGYAFI